MTLIPTQPLLEQHTEDIILPKKWESLLTLSKWKLWKYRSESLTKDKLKEILSLEDLTLARTYPSEYYEAYLEATKSLELVDTIQLAVVNTKKRMEISFSTAGFILATTAALDKLNHQQRVLIFRHEIAHSLITGVHTIHEQELLADIVAVGEKENILIYLQALINLGAKNKDTKSHPGIGKRLINLMKFYYGGTYA